MIYFKDRGNFNLKLKRYFLRINIVILVIDTWRIRMNSKIKRVVAINDMSGLGKCSLTVAIPILATLWLQT